MREFAKNIFLLDVLVFCTNSGGIQRQQAEYGISQQDRRKVKVSRVYDKFCLSLYHILLLTVALRKIY